MQTPDCFAPRAEALVTGFALAVTLFFASVAIAADSGDGAAVVSIEGFVEGRAALTGSPASWDEGGLGKTRFGGRGGSGRSLGRLQAGALLQANIDWDWSVNVSATAGGQQYNAVDAQEAYVRYKPAPANDMAIEARAGIFIPPVSLENTGLDWTSPLTLSPSALNAWIGDEIRGLGGEAAVTKRIAAADQSLKLRAVLGVFGFDDPAGALLAWRGWAVHDRTAGVFERHHLSALRTLQPGGGIPQQAPWVEPFHELDGRPGYYAGASLEDADRNQARVLYYDNRADTDVFDGQQYAWHTRFASLGARAELPGEITLIAQAMVGRTTMKLRPVPLGAVVDVTFSSAFLLASRAWDKHRVSARVEYFNTRDHDTTLDDNNAERGGAATLAYIYRPARAHRLTLELVRVQSKRPERVFLGLAARTYETVAQASWRVFF